MRFLASIALSISAFGQQFDVVSVKPQKWTGRVGDSVGVFVRGDTLNAEHSSLKGLVLFAYKLRGVQLSGGPAIALFDTIVIDHAEWPDENC